MDLAYVTKAMAQVTMDLAHVTLNMTKQVTLDLANVTMSFHRHPQQPTPATRNCPPASPATVKWRNPQLPLATTYHRHP